ncbi:MAG: hypothetical protein WA785_07780, partial [Candidatus Acidiferrales bacterium]
AAFLPNFSKDGAMAQHICTNENGIIELKRKPGRPRKTESLPESTLQLRAQLQAAGTEIDEELLAQIELQHRRWLQQQREEQGVVYSRDENGELQITTAPEFAEKISDAFDAGEIVEYPIGDARGIFEFAGGEGRVFGWKERPQYLG